MHSEICPVCQGSGKRYVNVAPGTAVESEVKECPGCRGQAYILVPDSEDFKIMNEIPWLRDMIRKKFEHSGGSKDDRKKYK